MGFGGQEYGFYAVGAVEVGLQAFVFQVGGVAHTLDEAAGSEPACQVGGEPFVGNDADAFLAGIAPLDGVAPFVDGIEIMLVGVYADAYDNAVDEGQCPPDDGGMSLGERVEASRE